jgi:hypothetical protein
VVKLDSIDSTRDSHVSRVEGWGPGDDDLLVDNVTTEIGPSRILPLDKHLTLLEHSELIDDSKQKGSLLDLNPRSVLEILEDATLDRLKHVPQERLVPKASLEQFGDREL